MTSEEKLVREYQKAQKKLVQIIMKKQAHGSAAAYERSLLRQIQKELKRLKKSSKTLVEQLVEKNYKTGLQSLIDDLLKDKTAPRLYNMFSGLNTSQIELIVQNTNVALNHVINLVGRQIQDAIREAGVEATAEKLTTGQTVREMQKILEKKLMKQDIMSVKYRNGRSVSVHKYAAMVSRSTTSETQNKAKTVQGQEWGYDLVRFTEHSPTCEVCSMYQGRVYALTKEAANGKYKGSDGQPLRFPYLYDTALPNGYSTIHPNCRHRLSVLPARAYTAKEMEEFSQKSTQPFEDMRSDRERKAYAKEQEIKRKRNESRKQYEKIKAALPNEAPKTFAAFIKMKTAKSERYKELLEDYKAVIGIAKQQESDIIKTRKLNSNNQVSNPMDKNKYNIMKRRLEQQGCPVIAAHGDDERFLLAFGAEAISDEYGILHLGDVPSASAFFEEIIHHTQFKKYGAIKQDDYIERAAREIAANRKLLKHGKTYGFTNDDFSDIETNLNYWEQDFKRRVGASYDESDVKREI